MRLHVFLSKIDGIASFFAFEPIYPIIEEGGGVLRSRQLRT